MSKCIACDCFLTDTELMMSRPDGLPEDMCHFCRGIAYNPESCDTHEYQHQIASEPEYLRYSIESEDFD